MIETVKNMAMLISAFFNITMNTSEEVPYSGLLQLLHLPVVQLLFFLPSLRINYKPRSQ